MIYTNTASQEMKARDASVREKMYLQARSRHFPRQLSGGQQQRVAVARAIINQPNLILADEPTGNLDSEHGAEVMKMLVQLNQEGTTILMVTHSMENAAYSSRTVRLYDGRLLSEEKEAKANG